MVGCLVQTVVYWLLLYSICYFYVEDYIKVTHHIIMFDQQQSLAVGIKDVTFFL